MKNRWARNLAVEILAFGYRYVYPIVIASMTLWVEKEYSLLAMGMGAILYAVYGVVGYRCRWKHIYCAFQSTRREPMTPENIRWHRMKKKDAYTEPVIFGVLGMLLLIVSFCVTNG